MLRFVFQKQNIFHSSSFSKPANSLFFAKKTPKNDSLDNVLSELKKKKNPPFEKPKSAEQIAVDDLEQRITESVSKQSTKVFDTARQIENESFASTSSPSMNSDFQQALRDIKHEAETISPDQSVDHLKKHVSKLSQKELEELLDIYEKNHGKSLQGRAMKRIVTETLIIGMLLLFIWKIAALKNEKLEYIDEKEAEIALIRGRIHQLQTAIVNMVSANSDDVFSRANNVHDHDQVSQKKLEPIVPPEIPGKSNDFRKPKTPQGISIAQDVVILIDKAFNNVRSAETMPKMMGKAELESESYYIGFGRFMPSGKVNQSIEGSSEFATSLLTPPPDFEDPLAIPMQDSSS